MITTTEALAAFCKTCTEHAYVTVDTEFLRERTYYSQLCLVQMAHPGEGDDAAHLIDPLASGLDLAPLYELFQNPNVVKVFHAARQDLEIFFVEGGVIPAPFFDTQVAAMVCGFGEQVGYETLVRNIAKANIDKSSRFTDWSKRPLSDKQQAYALADVTHLRDIYEYLSAKLEETGRAPWVAEETAVLTDPATYQMDPKAAWARIKTRNSAPRMMAIVRELAQYREETAQKRNIPRNRVLKDDAILELAGLKPKSLEDLSKTRLLVREMRRDPHASDLLAAVKRGLDVPNEDLPPAPKRDGQKRPGSTGLAELLRVLLKAKSEEAGVAAKLIASSADLDQLAYSDEADVPCLRGWRHELFGAAALDLKAGRIALSAGPKGVTMIAVETP